MPTIRSLKFIFGMLLLLSPLASSQTSYCHPYPGAVAQDCLHLIGENLNNIDPLACDTEKGSATMTHLACSITTKCAEGQLEVVRDEIVRHALTTIGLCALNDRGSISGAYTAEDGAKTCYLYPGR